MANFIEYASKAQEELNQEKQALATQASELTIKEAAVNKRSEELDKRETDIVTREKAQADTQAVLDIWKGKMQREEDVQKMFDEANAKLADVDEKLKQVNQVNLDNGQQLEELKKQSLRLSDEKANYREEVKKEMMDKFLGAH